MAHYIVYQPLATVAYIESRTNWIQMEDRQVTRIEIYTTKNCSYCVRAKALLRGKGWKYKEIDVSDDRELTQEMLKRSGRRTVPQIFINNQLIGGFTELAKLNSQGRLDDLQLKLMA